MIACKSKDLSTIKLLVEKGADVNAYSLKNGDKESTPLMEACKKNIFKIITYLVKNKANVNDEMSISYLIYLFLTME